MGSVVVILKHKHAIVFKVQRLVMEAIATLHVKTIVMVMVFALTGYVSAMLMLMGLVGQEIHAKQNVALKRMMLAVITAILFPETQINSWIIVPLPVVIIMLAPLAGVDTRVMNPIGTMAWLLRMQINKIAGIHTSVAQLITIVVHNIGHGVLGVTVFKLLPAHTAKVKHVIMRTH